MDQPARVHRHVYYHDLAVSPFSVRPAQVPSARPFRRARGCRTCGRSPAAALDGGEHSILPGKSRRHSPSLLSLAKTGTPPMRRGPERWPSGLRRTLGKRVCGKPYRGFESHSLRHFALNAKLSSICRRLRIMRRQPPDHVLTKILTSGQANR